MNATTIAVDLAKSVFQRPGSADPAPERSGGVGVGWNLWLCITARASTRAPGMEEQVTR